MKESIQAYEVSAAMNYHADEGPREMSLCMVFTAPDDYTAIVQAVDWAKDREKALGEIHSGMFFAAIKVSHYHIGHYDNDRHEFGTRRGMQFFEWKHDYPCTRLYPVGNTPMEDSLQDSIEAFRTRPGLRIKPYLTRQRLTTERLFNPAYDRDRTCKCGHPYYRHFDTHEDMLAVGCKYCGCVGFVAATLDDACEKCEGHGDISVTSGASGGCTRRRCSGCAGTGIAKEVSVEHGRKQSEG